MDTSKQIGKRGLAVMLNQAEVLRHTLTPGDFYDSIEQYRFEPDDFVTSVASQLPAQWDTRRRDVWLNVFPSDMRLPSEGWKIHLSSTMADAAGLLDAVAGELFRCHISFKFALDLQMLRLLNSRNWPRGGAGKFITVYPPTTERFLELGTRLAEITKGCEGPFILSDRRFPSSRVVHYRYGSMTRRIDSFGRSVSTLRGPGGEIPDERRAYFVLPPWLQDPVDGPRQRPTAEGPVSLNDGRFTVSRLIGARSAGGIYLGVDNERECPVIIKEARPLIGGDRGSDAVASLTNEHRLLERCAESGFTPRPVCLFWDWEHLFLAEEYIESSVTLGRYAARSTPLLSRQPSELELADYAELFVSVFDQLAAALEWLHGRGIAFGDLSPNNILVHQESHRLRLIDLEGASDEMMTLGPRVRTPGFSPKRAGRATAQAAQEDDLYALGANMLAFLFRINGMLELDRGAAVRFLNAITTELALQDRLRQLILGLMNDSPHDRPGLPAVRRLLRECVAIETKHPLERASIDWRDWAVRTMSFIVASVDYRRTDRLFPAAPQVFSTDPVNVAYGAAGVAYALNRVIGQCPSEVLTWIEAALQRADVSDGLYLGKAGVAWTLFEMGLDGRGLELLRQPPIAHRAELFGGAAGVGMANLKGYLRTGAVDCLDRALACGAELLQGRRETGGKYFWPGADTQAYGLGHGASGVALFFLYLGLATDDDSWIVAGRRALAFDIEHGVLSHGGGLTWCASDADKWRLLPYCESGSAGIGSVVLRYVIGARDDSLREVLDKICLATDYIKFAVLPGVCFGLAGIGEFMLDMWMITGDERWYGSAVRTAEGIVPFAVERPAGIAFPGDGQRRLCCDYATGGAGIACFFDRLARRSTAPFRLDELLFR